MTTKESLDLAKVGFRKWAVWLLEKAEEEKELKSAENQEETIKLDE